MEDRIARALQRIREIDQLQQSHTREIEQLLQGLTLELREINQAISAPVDAVPVAAAVPAPVQVEPDPDPEDIGPLSDGSRPPRPLHFGDKVRFFRTQVTCAGTGTIDGVDRRGWLIIKRVAPKGPCLIDPVTRAPWKVIKLDE